MRRILSFCTLFFVSISAPLLGQDSGGSKISCAQRLRLARATYEAGRLHELVGTILGPEAAGCFNDKDNDGEQFTIQEKVDALKLLTLAHIYLENPTEADKTMLDLLKTDHFYEPDRTSDPAEYLALYSTFRTAPIIAFTGRVGGTMTLPTLLTVYTATPYANAKFSPGVSFQVGLGVEKEFFPKAKGFLGNTEVIGEVMYVSRTFKEKDEYLYENGLNQEDTDPDNNNTPAGRNEYTSKSNWLDLNLILKYRFNKEHKLDPYIGAGAGLSMLLTSEIDLIQTQRYRNDGKTLTATVTGPAVDIKNSFHLLTNSATLIGGIKTKLGAIYLVFEGRAQFGLRNLINEETRTNQELLLDYHKQLNDYRQSNFSMNVGVTWPYFKPKKLSRKK